MKREDLEKMLPIIEEIDGGCSACIEGFCDNFNELGFPFLLWWSNGRYSSLAVFSRDEYRMKLDEYGDCCGVVAIEKQSAREVEE